MAAFDSIFPKQKLDREVDEELAFHVESRIRDNLAAGMAPAAAREEALRRFGDLAEVRAACRRIGLERIRSERRADVLDHLARDVTLALRRLWRSPGFTAAVVLILALGIGGSGAIFSVVDGVLLEPLPFPEPDRLVLLWGVEEGLKSGSSWTSYPDLVDFEAGTTAFQGLAAWASGEAAVTAEGVEPAKVPVARACRDLFGLLGVRPFLGRGFLPEEDRPGGGAAVVLSHGFWSRHLGADPTVLGRPVGVDGVPHEVVGVLPPGFDFAGAEAWLPLGPTHASDDRGQHRLLVLGRLADGVSLEEATAEVETVAARLEAAHPESNTGRGARLEPLHESVVAEARPTLLLFLAAVALVLLIACANVASLLLARAVGRDREVAIRRALGAGRGRLLRAFLVEGLVLTGLGGLAGAGLAHLAVGLLRGVESAAVPRLSEVSVDGSALALLALLTVLTGVLFGLVPGLHLARRPAHGELVRSGPGSGGGRPRLRQSLVVVEVALAVVLLAGAGLLVNSFLQLRSVDPGFTGRDVLVVPVPLPESRYGFDRWPETVAFHRELAERVGALPGVEAAVAAHQHPLAGGWETGFELPGVFERPEGERPEARIRPVQPGYFRTVGIPLLEGRDFTARDRAGGPGVVIVNRALARHFFGDGSPVGRTLAKNHWWDYQDGEWEIVGVVGDVKMDGLATGTPWAMYFPHAQMPFNDMSLLVRTEGDPPAVAAAVRREVARLDPQLPVGSPRALDELRLGSLARQRLLALLLGAFAALALLLSAVGLYGVLAYLVGRRTREIGVRMSLGARTRDVLATVLGQGLALVAAGLALGMAAALALSRFLEGMLYGVGTTDPPTLVAVCVLLLLAAALACLAPALRAVRVDPAVALRTE